MAAPIFVDANVPMYAAGRAHPLKQPCVDVLMLVAAEPSAFITDAEVFQEILHRYRAIGRWPEGEQLFLNFAQLMAGRVADVTLADVETAARLANSYPGLNARDLLHLAVMRRVRATSVVTADTGFDAVSDVERLDPAAVATWQGRIATTS